MKIDYAKPYYEPTDETISILAADNDPVWGGDSNWFRNSLIGMGIVTFSLIVARAIGEWYLFGVIAALPL